VYVWDPASPSIAAGLRPQRGAADPETVNLEPCNGMGDSLAPRPDPKGSPPARRLSTEEMEAVVRRAVELQMREPEHGADPGISEAELLRIGRELGIEPAHMRRAMAEVSTASVTDESFLDRTVGSARVSASRTIAGDPEKLRQHLERYMMEGEYLAVLRRLPDHTIFEKSSGFSAEVVRVVDMTGALLTGRARQPRIGAGFELRTVQSVEVAVQPLEDGFAYVTLAADLRNQRSNYVGGSAAGGGVGTFFTAMALGIAIAPPAALLALPILGGSLWAARVGYQSLCKRAQLHLEALLDHLERGETLLVERKPGSIFG
jgi:hypothetical protein